MGAKGRKRKQLRKAKNRAGLLKNLSGPHSKNQRDKRELLLLKRRIKLEKIKRLLGF